MYFELALRPNILCNPVFARSKAAHESTMHACTFPRPQVVQLKRDFKLKISEAEALKLDLERAENTLNAATSLLRKLAGEKERWERQASGGGGACVWCIECHCCSASAVQTRGVDKRWEMHWATTVCPLSCFVGVAVAARPTN